MDVVPEATCRRSQERLPLIPSPPLPGLLEGEVRGTGSLDECLVFFSMQTQGFRCLVVGLLAMNFVGEDWICLILMHVKVRLKGGEGTITKGQGSSASVVLSKTGAGEDPLLPPQIRSCPEFSLFCRTGLDGFCRARN